MPDERCAGGKIAKRSFLINLPDSQAGLGRHKCVTCAYNEGLAAQSTPINANPNDLETCDHGRVAPKAVLRRLHDEQGGSGRHKCCVCAYSYGLATAISTNVPLPNDAQVVIQEVQRPQVLPTTPRKISKIVQRAIDNDQIKEIGLRGELYVLKYEKQRLTDAGMPDLVERVEHVSVTRGDGLGYDILSFETTGAERHIEVKTTTQTDIKTPFFLTSNELNFSKTSAASYFLYRVFSLNGNPQFFILSGDLTPNTTLEPKLYLAYPR